MRRQIIKLILLCSCAGQSALNAQEFKLFSRSVQVHGFASQGFVHTDHNNWRTMYSSHVGSGEFTDFGANVSMQVTDKLRIGAQVYDRNLGHLGDWHPSLDWAFADYWFKPWFGIRGGKVKTVLGLYNDTQDFDFLHTFAFLPQSVYPTDLRDATIAHLGGDIYGKVSLPRSMGSVSYTAYAGHRSDSLHGGNAYLASEFGVHYSSYSGPQYGGDLRWTTPLKGLLIGSSRVNGDLTGRATFINPLNPTAGIVPYSEVSKADWTDQFYGRYTVGKLRVDSEYRRFVHDGIINRDLMETITDVRGWYISGAYRVIKRLELGSYYSRYSITSVSGGGALSAFAPHETDTNLPANHIYDNVITARIDVAKFWNVKIEGHFMDGYGSSTYPNGFYPQVNAQGFKPNTNALVVRTSLDF